MTRNARPVDLVTFGLPNCYLHLVPDSILVIGHALGFGQFTYPLPADQGLVGIRYHVQALVPDPAAPNPAHALMSNALVLQIGSR